MTEGQASPDTVGWSWSENRQRQLQEGLRMSPAERLAWLEEMLDELLPYVGVARTAQQAGNTPKR